MTKIKLLFDMEQLSINGLKGTGIVRVGNALFHELFKNEEIDLYPFITTKRGDVKAYLKAKGYEALVDKIVRLPQLEQTTKNLKWYHRLYSKLLIAIYHKKYCQILSQYDAYFSLYNPISEIVYNSNIKTFLMIHDIIPIVAPEGCSPKFVKKFTDWINRAHPDAYFTVSNFTAQDLIRYKPKAQETPMYTLYLGAQDHFKPCSDVETIEMVKTKYHINTPKYFLAVSEITKRKNLPHLLQAFVRFLDNNNANDISLVLVGPVRSGYDEVAQSIDGIEKYKDKIVQTGYADDEDLPVLYSGATAFIYPSLYEGFGLPVLEGMQCGVPVVTCDNTSLPEVGGDAVLYVKGNDVNETAEVLYKLYTNPALRQSMSEKGLRRAQQFSWTKMAHEFVNDILKETKGKQDG